STVSDRKSFSFRMSPSRTEASALTIVTDEQIRMNVFSAVSQMFSVLPGCGQVGLAKRSTMYDPMSPVKNMTSEQRKTHIPILSCGIPVAVGGSRTCSCAIAWFDIVPSGPRQHVLADSHGDQNDSEDQRR